jgi:hypothetical protein
MTGDGSQEMDHGRQMTIGLFSIRSYCGYVKLYDSRDYNFGFELQISYGTEICMYTMYRRHGFTEYDTEHYSEMTN